MTRAPRAALAIVLVVAAAACGDDAARAGAGSEPAEPTIATPLELFPLSPGDRWRIETEDGATTHNVGVTGRERSGVAVIHGTGHALAERYRATDGEVALVDPEGHVLVPLLRAPLRAGAQWEYALRDRDAEVPCVATVRTTGVTERAAGATLERCVEVRRRCTYAEGEPFARATTHTTDELYCPGVGRVREVGVFDPAPPISLLPARRAERVVGWRVAGAPAMPEPVGYGCASLILLPSDVQAACGAAVQPVAEVAGESGDERCTYRYRAQAGDIEIRAERRREPIDDAAIDLAIAPDGETSAIRTQEGVRIAVGSEVRLALGSGRTLVAVTADAEACPEESALRLAPLLRSLIAR